MKTSACNTNPVVMMQEEKTFVKSVMHFFIIKNYWWAGRVDILKIL